MANAIVEKKVRDLITNNAFRSSQAIEWNNRYTTDELPIDTRDTPKWLESNNSNVEEDQRLVNAYDSEIVENRINYIMSNTPIFQYTDKDETQMELNQNLIDDWVKESGFILTFRELAQIAGATGNSSLLLYLGTDSEGKSMVDTRALSPWEFVFEFGPDKKTVVSAVRYWKILQFEDGNDTETETSNDETTNTKEIHKAEYYVNGKMYILKGKSQLDMVVIEEKEDLIGKLSGVPMLELMNNTERKPSFYKVISLIDAYNGLTSDFTNEMAGFRNAILALTGAILKSEDSSDDSEAVKRLKEYRMLFMEEGAKAEYITKEIKHEATEFLCRQLEKNIERFANHLNYSDPEVYGRATNLAISTRIKPLENAAKKLIMHLNKTLTGLFKALGAYWLDIRRSSTFDWKKVNIIFTLDKPVNDVEEVEKVEKSINAGISKETAFGQVSFIKDPKAEIERKQAEIDNESSDDNFNQNTEPETMTELDDEDTE